MHSRNTTRAMRSVIVAALCLAAAACASVPPRSISPGTPAVQGVRIIVPAKPLECVPYARRRSGIRIHGDAWTWWAHAAGLYRRSHAPSAGAVIVFSRKGGTEGGHVAVVRAITSARELRVDHANWLGRGRIFLNDPVRDVSADNDWSAVQVWNADAEHWGGRTYPITGFVGPGAAGIAAKARK